MAGYLFSFWKRSYIHMHVSFTLWCCFFDICCQIWSWNPSHPLTTLCVSVVASNFFFSVLVVLGFLKAPLPPFKWPPLFLPGHSPQVPAPLPPALCLPPHAQSAPSTSTPIFDPSQLLCLSLAGHPSHLKAQSLMSVSRSWSEASSGPPRREEKQ